MKKKYIILILVVAAIITFIAFAASGGLPTINNMGEDTTGNKITDASKLQDGCYYVYHEDAFYLCPVGDKNWSKKDTTYAHTLWFTSDNDKDIPTLYPGDQLIYVSSTDVPYSGIAWEHYADYGYSIGIANMIEDKSGHYRITNSSTDGSNAGFSCFIYDKSDANALSEFATNDLFLNKLGNVAIREDSVSASGVVANLEKNKKYVCEWYTGTYYQDFEMTANIRPFVAFETFTTYNYEFLHSNCISIEIPSWFKTGYYYVQDLGLFRYVSEEDAGDYNGEPFDEDLDWNQSVKEYNEEGVVIFDPTMEGYDDDTKSSGTSSIVKNNSEDEDTDADEDLDESDGSLEDLMNGANGNDMTDVEVTDGSDGGIAITDDEMTIMEDDYD